MENTHNTNNTHNITINPDRPLFGESGNVTFSLTEFDGDLGIDFDQTIKPIIGRVVGQHYVYLCGIITNNNDIAFVIFDSKNLRVYNAYFEYNLFVMVEKGFEKSENDNDLICAGKYDASEDYNYNLPWFKSLDRKLEKSKSVSPEICVFYNVVRNSSGVELFNNLIKEYNNNDKGMMVFAIMHYIFTHNIKEIQNATKDMKLIERISLMHLINKFKNFKYQLSKRELAYKKCTDKLFSAPHELVERLFTMLSKNKEDNFCFPDYEQSLMEECMRCYLDGHTFSLT